jgi:uncharacterized coiled-coil protein SlyX
VGELKLVLEPGSELAVLSAVRDKLEFTRMRMGNAEERLSRTELRVRELSSQVARTKLLISKGLPESAQMERLTKGLVTAFEKVAEKMGSIQVTAVAAPAAAAPAARPGRMDCPHCTRAIPAASKYCKYCGKRVSS